MIIVAILFFILLIVVAAYLAVFLGGIVGGIFGIRKAKREAAAHGMSLKEYRALNKQIAYQRAHPELRTVRPPRTPEA